MGSRRTRQLQPGGFRVAHQLATVMLVQALRPHLADGLRGGVGWLFTLAGWRVAAAISAMHNEPARRRTLQSLAARAGMSRHTPDHCTALIISKIGKYIATTIPPTTTPNTTIISGSNSDNNALTAASTSPS